MNIPSDPSDNPQEPRTTREKIDAMPTPTSIGGAFALFAAIEMEAIEEGRSTPEESVELLREVFSTPTDTPE